MRARRTAGRVVAAALLALAASGCTPDEAALGDQAAREVDRQVHPVRDARAQQDLARFGTLLLRAVPPTPWDWHFTLVRDPSINAFALPGGHVYVQTGLLAAAQSPDELAGVLGHEIAHAVLHHGVHQQRKQQVGNAVILGVCLVTGWCDGGLSRVAIDVGQAAIYSKFSRTDELQADSAGALFARRAGFDPHAIARFFRRLESQRTREPGIERYFASHPMEETRIARIEALIGPGPAPSAPDSVVALFADLKARSAVPARARPQSTSATIP